MTYLDELIEEQNKKLEEESLKRMEQERVEAERKEQERKDAEHLARINKVKKIVHTAIHPFKATKGKRVAKKASKII